MHRSFSEIDNAYAVVEFADKFGMLGRIQRIAANGSQPAEPVEYWLGQARAMRVLIKLLDISNEGEAHAMKVLKGLPSPSHSDFGRLIDVPGEPNFLSMTLLGSVHPPSARYAARLGGLMSRMYPHESGAAFSYVLWARLVISDGINAQFREGVHPAVEQAYGSPVYLVPQDLLGALYALLAEELMGSAHPLEKCPICGKWFQAMDPRRVTCSSACKQKAWRISRRLSKKHPEEKTEYGI
jgi:hypothetical protein